MKKSTHIIPILYMLLLLNSHHIPMKKPTTNFVTETRSAIPTAHGHGIGTTTPGDSGTGKIMEPKPWVNRDVK